MYAPTFMPALSIQSGSDACTEHTRQELAITLSIQVRNWCMRWAYGSGTDVCTDHTCQELMRALSTHMKFEKVPSKYAEHTELMRALRMRVRNWCVPWADASGTDAYAEIADHPRKEMMCTLSILIISLCECSACAQEMKWCLTPQKIKIISLYFSPKVTYPERLYGVKILKIQAIENLTLGHNVQSPYF